MSDVSRRRTWAVLIGLVLILGAVGAGLMMRGDSDGSQTVTAAGGTHDEGADEADEAAADTETGTVRVQLEPVDGIFIEGFEVGIRFESTDGEVISSTLWSDHVQSLGQPDMDAYYDSVLDQQVPAGEVVVRAQAEVGAGPGPSIPDLTGDLPCRLAVDVEPGQVVTVEVAFHGEDDCLRQVSAEGGPRGDPEQTTTSTPEPTTTIASQIDTSTPPGSSVPGEHGNGPQDLTVGSSHHVDVDLECKAFVLGGTWILVDGDPSTWQPPGERHEGGTFTIEGPGRGRFSGDAEGRKSATFRLLGPTEEPACPPVPRPQPPT